jgi:DNA polymerase-3 subunit epsilon
MGNRHDYTGSGHPMSRWASRLCASERFLVVDIETTDLGSQAEPVEIAILNGAGDVVLDTLVRPDGEISSQAFELHGLSSEILAEAPSFDQVSSRLWRILHGREVAAFHSDFDRRVLWAAFARRAQPAPRCRWHCLCDLFEDWHGSRRTLGGAAKILGIDAASTHRALADARIELAILRRLSGGEAH